MTQMLRTMPPEGHSRPGPQGLGASAPQQMAPRVPQLAMPRRPSCADAPWEERAPRLRISAATPRRGMLQGDACRVMGCFRLGTCMCLCAELLVLGTEMYGYGGHRWVCMPCLVVCKAAYCVGVADEMVRAPPSTVKGDIDVCTLENAHINIPLDTRAGTATHGALL